MNKLQIMHIHGGMAFNSYGEYLDYLKNNFEISYTHPKDQSRWSRNYYRSISERIFQVISPDMPSKNNAKYSEWKILFEHHLPFIEDNIILVGHSLGGIFLAKYLSENNTPFSIAQLHLVAAVYDHEDEIEQLGDFKLSDFPGKLLGKNIPEIHLYHSKDDDIVPISESEKYHTQIPGSHFHVFEDRYHFLDETFPELFENIKCIKEL